MAWKIVSCLVEDLKVGDVIVNEDRVVSVTHAGSFTRTTRFLGIDGVPDGYYNRRDSVYVLVEVPDAVETIHLADNGWDTGMTFVQFCDLCKSRELVSPLSCSNCAKDFTFFSRSFVLLHGDVPNDWPQDLFVWVYMPVRGD